MKVLLIDDEPLALNHLELQLSRITEFEALAKFTSSKEAKEFIKNNQVDVIFLDIEMPGLNGIELAEAFIVNNPEILIVFVTAHHHFAIKAFELNALDYLLKPIKFERLKNTIERLKNQMKIRKENDNKQDQQVIINLFDEPTIYYGNMPMDLKWRTSKAKQLFLYLIHNRGRIASNSELIELFWPDFDIEKALTQLYTTIYQIRKTLQVFHERISVLKDIDGYQIKLENVIIDVDVLEEFVQKNQVISRNTINNYESVMNLFKGEYVQRLDYTWADNDRFRLRKLWLSTKIKMIEWYRDNNDTNKAFEHALDIYQRYPLEEEGYFELMKIFAICGDSSLVKKYYTQLESVLQQDLGVEPSIKIQNWYKKWLKDISVRM